MSSAIKGRLCYNCSQGRDRSQHIPAPANAQPAIAMQAAVSVLTAARSFEHSDLQSPNLSGAKLTASCQPSSGQLNESLGQAGNAQIRVTRFNTATKSSIRQSTD
ncbi:hypothetical protein [Microcoleus sp. herbarium12]|uniref:hypothetical protein n=1 Tax=Microcoleus sp. herbarium12 TaxID=3055437 RepID=UPI002FCE83D9